AVSGRRGDVGTGIPCLFDCALQVCGHRRSTYMEGSARGFWTSRAVLLPARDGGGRCLAPCAPYEAGDPFGGFDALLLWSDQSDPDTAGAGVLTMRFACQEAARQGGDAGGAVKIAHEIGIVARRAGPQVEGGVGPVHVQHGFQYGQDRLELFTVEPAILD